MEVKTVFSRSVPMILYHDKLQATSSWLFELLIKQKTDHYVSNRQGDK